MAGVVTFGTTGPGEPRPRALWLRLTSVSVRLGACRRGSFDTERASSRHNQSRIYGGVRRRTLVADHEGRGPTFDERLVRAVRCSRAVRVVGRDGAGLDNHDH